LGTHSSGNGGDDSGGSETGSHKSLGTNENVGGVSGSSWSGHNLEGVVGSPSKSLGRKLVLASSGVETSGGLGIWETRNIHTRDVGSILLSEVEWHGVGWQVELSFTESTEEMTNVGNINGCSSGIEGGVKISKSSVEGINMTTCTSTSLERSELQLLGLSSLPSIGD